MRKKIRLVIFYWSLTSSDPLLDVVPSNNRPQGSLCQCCGTDSAAARQLTKENRAHKGSHDTHDRERVLPVRTLRLGTDANRQPFARGRHPPAKEHRKPRGWIPEPPSPLAPSKTYGFSDEIEQKGGTEPNNKFLKSWGVRRLHMFRDIPGQR